MNLHTFKDVTNAKKSSLVNDLDEGDEEKEVGVLRKPVDGEEEEGDDKFNEAGEVLEPFNLRDERDSGHFDENMNFVFQKEKGEIDAWLADMDEAAMERGIGEAAKALKLRNDKISQAEATARNTVKKSSMELKVELLRMMKPGENVVQTMRRLSGKSLTNKKTKRRIPKSAQNSNSGHNSQNGDFESETKEQKLANKIALESFTDLADELLSTGLSGVYDMTYESIETSAVRWEYRGLDGVIHGPFTPQIIASWKSQGYFTGSSSVMMRKVGVVGRDWQSNTDTNSLQKSGISDPKSGISGSSSSQENITGKVRFNFDESGTKSENENATKKRKINEEKEEESSAQDLMNDLEDDEDEEDSAEYSASSGSSVSVSASASVVASSLDNSGASSIAGSIDNSVGRVEEELRGQWISSDDIDFDVNEEKSEETEEVEVEDDEDDV